MVEGVTMEPSMLSEKVWVERKMRMVKSAEKSMSLVILSRAVSMLCVKPDWKDY